MSTGSETRDAFLTTPVLLPARDYIADATDRIRHARRRVYVMALTIAHESHTNDLIDALVDAARRGVDVHVAADGFTYADAAGAFLPKRYVTKRQRESSLLASMLTKAGATFTWLGRERGLIFRGRTHTKLCVVDDVAYCFGGVNLDDQGVTNVDYMFRIDDWRLADDLVEVYRRIQHMNARERGHRSKVITFGTEQVLVDGGAVGDSVIYRRAVKHARKAVRTLLLSQYCPTGELGAVIKRTDHQFYFNPPGQASLFNCILIRASMLTNRTSTQYTRKEYLHAKCIVYTRRNGRKVAITGSHNFVRAGVMLGTREIALQTKDPAVIAQLEEFFRTHVGPPQLAPMRGRARRVLTDSAVAG